VAEIARLLSGPECERMETDFKKLVSRVRESDGELQLMLRDGYFNLYYQGNSLAKVSFGKAGTYRVKVNLKFAGPDGPRRLSPEEASGEWNTTMNGRELEEFLSRDNIAHMKAAVRAVDYQPETTFEQLLMAHNPPSRDLVIIDRQVQRPGKENTKKKKMDLLALRRTDAGRYRFVVMEVKLGTNKELASDVAGQLHAYMNHVEEHFDDFAVCYKKVYEQRLKLKLWPDSDSMPKSVEIERPVEGRVVVFGLSDDVLPKIGKLEEADKDIDVDVFDFKLKPWPAG
jgi:hypothetical protein